MQSARCCIVILLRHGLAQKKVWRQRISTRGDPDTDAATGSLLN
jgi:hypothetical protein